MRLLWFRWHGSLTSPKGSQAVTTKATKREGCVTLGGTATHDLLIRLINIGDKEDSLVGKITSDVARDIIEGQLAPGDDLNSIDLAQRFKTSRTPVRESLLLLERGGLVEIRPRRRPRVVALSPTTIVEIYTLRAEFYALVSRRVAELATPEEIAILTECVDRMRCAARTGELDSYFWNNVLFHEQAATFARNAALKQSLDGLGLQVLQLRHKSMSSAGRIERSLEDHARLVRAFRERDGQLAAALSRSIILSALKLLKESQYPTHSQSISSAPFSQKEES
jgi:DNA-binding GntR family transcriptional regulator